jgi:NAD+ synthase
MQTQKKFSRDLILLDNIEKVVTEIVEKLRYDVHRDLKRFGAIVGISGGIDSSVCLALATLAFGQEKVLGVIMPELDSNPDSEKLARMLAIQFGIEVIKEDLTQILTGYRCYERRDEAVRSVCPDFDPSTWRMKINIKQSNIFSNLPPVFFLTLIGKNGNIQEHILPVKEYLQIVAASNFKQRSRMSMLYYHAELNHYCVIGTPNKHEYQQGFFVKYGDGGADVMPIVNLYKTQVYQLAKHIGVPNEIIERTPTTDTYSAEQTQEEFFYQMPFELMDIYWYAYENKYSADEVARVMKESKEHVEAIFRNLERKRKTTLYLRMQPKIDYFGLH